MQRRMSQWGEAAMICIMAGLLAACSGGSGSIPQRPPAQRRLRSPAMTPIRMGDGLQDSADLCPTVLGPSF